MKSPLKDINKSSSPFPAERLCQSKIKRCQFSGVDTGGTPVDHEFGLTIINEFNLVLLTSLIFARLICQVILIHFFVSTAVCPVGLFLFFL